MNQKLVLVRGASCSGKTTICRELRSWEKKIAWLSVDKVKPFFSDFKDEAMDDVNKTAIVILEDLLSRNFSVVMDGIFKNPQHLYDAVAVAKRKNIPVIIYQLEVALQALKQRDKTREGVAKGWFEPLGDELIEGLYRKVEENPIEGVIKLNTEEKSPEECVGIIRQNFE